MRAPDSADGNPRVRGRAERIYPHTAEEWWTSINTNHQPDFEPMVWWPKVASREESRFPAQRQEFRLLSHQTVGRSVPRSGGNPRVRGRAERIYPHTAEQKSGGPGRT